MVLQLLIVLFALTSAKSLQELNVESRKNNKAAWQWMLDDDDGSDTAGPTSLIALPPGEGGDVMGSVYPFPMASVAAIPIKTDFFEE